MLGGRAVPCRAIPARFPGIRDIALMCPGCRAPHNGEEPRHPSRTHEDPDVTAATEPELREAVPSHREADALVAAAWQAHSAVLLGAVARSTRDREVAEDIVAEAFEALLREARAGRVPASTPAWLHRVARNRVIDWSRRRARWAGHGPAEPTFAADPEATVLGREAADALHAALASLPEAGRRAVMLEGLGYRPAEIAPLLGRTNQATRTLLCRARRRVAVELAGAID